MEHFSVWYIFNEIAKCMAMQYESVPWFGVHEQILD
jgi:hypothetical protein